MNFKESTYWTLYADIVNYHRKFVDVREDDNYWQRVVDEAGVFFEKYENFPESEFAKQLVLNVLDELERIYRRNQNEKK